MIDQIRRLVADVLGVATDQLNAESNSETVPEWTSLAHVNLVLTLESRFNVAFAPEEVLELTSLSAIESILQNKIGSEVAPTQQSGPIIASSGREPGDP